MKARWSGMDRDLEMARKVAQAVRSAGGRTYYVGGYVRDMLLGRKNKDIDIEVHGITVPCLNSILDGLGERVTMGASFGIMGLRHYDLDIAMPRSETATGRGHKDFEVFVDPFLGEEKAAARRDFTMNALMQDVLTGEVLDFFGGQEDMKRGRIRHVNDAGFAEDPLRVFRAAQFAARFGFDVAEETVAVSSGMDVSALAGERVFMELEKALLKSEKPSLFFEVLRKMNQLSVWFPEVQGLISVPQRKEFHPEGDVWTHTMQVVDGAARVREKASQPLWFMLAALCHDFGKQTVTVQEGGHVHAYRHETEGLPLIRTFLGRLTTEVRLTDYVLNMTHLHMQPIQMVRSHSRIRSFMDLYDRSVCPGDLILLARADYMGRIGDGTQRDVLLADWSGFESQLMGMLQEYEDRMSRPYLMGRDLLEAGIPPGPLYTELLTYAHKLRLSAVPKDEQLRHVLAMVQKTQEHPAAPPQTSPES